ncbi:hypothetical protein, partial [Vibrio parahaemolyticus]|uniref:hypothetical protein n=1 Tax=Vibrio parahaemolyticus TaxID=670 RepID=UPI001C5FC6C0
MAHLGARAFGQISGEVVQTTAWVMSKAHVKTYKPLFFRLIDGNEQVKKSNLKKRYNPYSTFSQYDFLSLPGCTIAYWITKNVRDLFRNNNLATVADLKMGMRTGDN